MGPAVRPVKPKGGHTSAVACGDGVDDDIRTGVAFKIGSESPQVGRPRLDCVDSSARADQAAARHRMKPDVGAHVEKASAAVKKKFHSRNPSRSSGDPG